MNSITAKVPRCTYAGKVTGLRRDPQRRLLSIGQFGRACPAVPPQEENRRPALPLTAAPATPVLIDAGFPELDLPIPWWGGLSLRFGFPPR